MDGGRRRAQEGQLASVAGISARIVERRTRPAWCGVLFLVLALSACNAVSPTTQAKPSQLVVGFPEGNVAADVGPRQFGNMLAVEGLTWASVDGRSVPRLAERWEWRNGGLELRIFLRPGVFFHDGTPLTATVAAEILSRSMARPDAQAQYSSLADISAVTPVNDLELSIELLRRSAFLLDDLNIGLQVQPQIGTGPYRLVKREDREMRFERFDRYYQGAASIQTIVLKTFDELRTAWSSLLRSEVDMVTDVPAEAIEFVRTEEVNVIPFKRWYQFIVAFNSAKTPFTSPAVRRALNIAVDREALIARALRGYATPATGPLWPKHWAYDNNVAPYAFDQQLAESLLDGAGFRRGAAGSSSPVPTSRLRFTCLIPEGFSLQERIGLELQKQLYDIGVDMQFEVVPPTQIEGRMARGNYDAIFLDMISGPSFGKAYLFWRSAKTFKGLNYFGYENAEAERLFQVLRDSALNEAATRSATNRLQRVFLDDPPALFLAWNERTRVVGPKFRAVIEPDRDPVLTMWRWTPNSPPLTASR
jgi:peptide/nickel transport system substrate-binding protein